MIPTTGEKIAIKGLLGTLHRFSSFPSSYVLPRHVDIWTPPGYTSHPEMRCPVVYMQDGQNLFDPATAYGGVDWGVDETAARLADAGDIPAPIVVAVWNTPLRWREYMPQKVYEVSCNDDFKIEVLETAGGAPLSDSYLKFMVYELKPWVDANFRTRPEQPDTYVMGSSMGALLSLYAALEYPCIFGGAGCLSTHFPAGGESMMIYLLGSLPNPGRQRFYFDYGTETLDSAYEPYQRRVDGVMLAAGYAPGLDWLTLKFEGQDHSEGAWRKRLHQPIEFLLGR